MPILCFTTKPKAFLHMIKRLELINFMSHEHTVIEPSSGLTVLIGPNNCGKSAIVTALQILCNNPKSTYVLRHGAKECKIIVETDTGDVIQWSRKKSGSPKYHVNGELFDRLKSSVPQEVHQILRMPQVQVDKESFDVHFGEQTSPLFLLGDKEKAAAQFFASSSDAIRLVEMQDRHKSNITVRKRDLKRVTKQREEIAAENAILLPITALHKTAVNCEKFGIEISEEKKLITELSDAVTAIQTTQQRSDLLSKQNDALKEIPKPPTMQPTSAIKTMIAAVETAQQQIEHADFGLDAMTDLQQPPKLQPTERLKQLVTDLQQNLTTETIAGKRLTALTLLSQPPEITLTSELEKTIHLLVTAQQKSEAADVRLKALESLPQVPELPSTSALKELIKRYNELLTLIAEQNKQLDANNKMIQDVEDELETWLDDNPQCPTCGAKVTKDQLLETTGGHVHA